MGVGGVMDELIDRLEKAEVGGRELDAEIGAWLEANAGDDHGPGSNYHLSKQKTWMGVKGWEWRRWSTSIDAALTLVPADGDHVWNLYDDFPCDIFWAVVTCAKTPEYVKFASGDCPTPALALCIAALRARGARHD